MLESVETAWFLSLAQLFVPVSGVIGESIDNTTTTDVEDEKFWLWRTTKDTAMTSECTRSHLKAVLPSLMWSIKLCNPYICAAMCALSNTILQCGERACGKI